MKVRLALFGALLGLSGCGREDPLIGVWQDQEGEILSFQSDGKVIGKTANLRAKLKNGTWKRLGDGRVAIFFVRYFSLDEVVCETTSAPDMTVLECDPDVGQVRLTRASADALQGKGTVRR